MPPSQLADDPEGEKERLHPSVLRAEREALSLIRWLRNQFKPQSEWLDAITADQTLSDPVR